MIIENFEHIKNLTYTEKILADYIMNYPEKVLNLSATNLANECHVALSGVTRLIQKLGYKNYSEFKIEFAKNYQKMLEISEFSKVTPFVKKTSMGEIKEKLPILYQKAIKFTEGHLDEKILDKIIEQMNEAIICIYGTGINYSLAKIAEYKLEELGIMCKAQDSLHMQMVDLFGYTKKKSFAIFLTHSADNPGILQASQRIRDNKIPSLLISSANKKGEIENYVDYKIEIIPTKNTSEFSSTLWSTSIQYILDILVAGLYVKQIDLINDLSNYFI